MKAWCVFDVSPVDGVLLVFAATRNRARALACNQALWDWEYVGTSAIRKQKWDSFFDAERVIETNDDLPAGAPEFYDDWEL